MTRARVLVVEDEGVVALALRKCLENIGYEVAASVATGEEAVRKARELEPDVILMDIRLKGAMDGIEAASRILKTAKVPVIYLTAYSDDKTLERARSTEPFGYLLKPFDQSSVKSAIEMTLHKAVSEAEVRNRRDRLSEIINHIAESVVVVDFKGIITFATPRAEQSLGASGGRVVGRPYREVLNLLEAASGASSTLPVSRAFLERQDVYLTGLVLVAADGSRLPVDLNISPIKDDAGAVAGIAVTFHPRPSRS